VIAMDHAQFKVNKGFSVGFGSPGGTLGDFSPP